MAKLSVSLQWAVGWRVALTQQTLRVALAAQEGREGALLETLVLEELSACNFLFC